MKIRMKDIAEKANVSPATVSNVFNERGGVSESTSRRVLSVAREIGYDFTKNSIIEKNYVRLVSFKRHGLVIMDTQFFAEIIDAMERRCHESGLKMVISNIQMTKDDDYLEKVQEICEEECAGILLLATEMSQQDLELFSCTKSPLVVVDSLFQNVNFNCVVMNNREAGYIATEHLIKNGHTKIHHITSSVGLNNMKYRRLGYEDAMMNFGLQLESSSIWSVTPTLEGAYNDMLSLIENNKNSMPTAFFAANDIIAVGCVRALKDKGYKIPDDISIIGMDDMDICKTTSPVLSTIRVFRADIASTAVKRLLELIKADSPSCILKTQVGIELVNRESVKNLNQ